MEALLKNPDPVQGRFSTTSSFGTLGMVFLVPHEDIKNINVRTNAIFCVKVFIWGMFWLRKKLSCKDMFFFKMFFTTKLLGKSLRENYKL